MGKLEEHKGKSNKNNRKITKSRPPARTDQEQEERMINLAMIQAEKMLEAGKAPTQVVIHYLKLASSSEKLDQNLKGEQTKLVSAKAQAVRSAERIEELYVEAREAMIGYRGSIERDGETDED